MKSLNESCLSLCNVYNDHNVDTFDTDYDQKLFGIIVTEIVKRFRRYFPVNYLYA